MIIERLDVKFGDHSLIVLPNRIAGYFYWVESEDQIGCDFDYRGSWELPEAVSNYINDEIRRAYNEQHAQAR